MEPHKQPHYLLQQRGGHRDENEFPSTQCPVSTAKYRSKVAFSRPPNLSAASEKPRSSIPYQQPKEVPATQHTAPASVAGTLDIPEVAQRGVLLCVKRKREEVVNDVVVLEERPSKVRKQDLETLASAIATLVVSQEQQEKPASAQRASERKVFRYLGRKDEVLTTDSRMDLQKKIQQVKEKRRNKEPPKTELSLDKRAKNTLNSAKLARQSRVAKLRAMSPLEPSSDSEFRILELQTSESETRITNTYSEADSDFVTEIYYLSDTDDVQNEDASRAVVIPVESFLDFESPFENEYDADNESSETEDYPSTPSEDDDDSWGAVKELYSSSYDMSEDEGSEDDSDEYNAFMSFTKML